MKARFPAPSPFWESGLLRGSSAALLSLPASPVSAPWKLQVKVGACVWGTASVSVCPAHARQSAKSHLRQVNEIMSKQPFDGSEGMVMVMLSWRRKLRSRELL